MGQQQGLPQHHGGRRVGAGRQHPVQIGPQAGGIPRPQGPVGETAAMPERHHMAVVHDEAVRHHPRLPQHALPGGDVVGVEIGQQLEQGRGHHHLAHAARVEGRFGPVLGIDRPGWIAQVQHRQGIAVRIAPQQPGHLAAEGRIRRGQAHMPPGQTQVHLVQAQARPRGLHPGARLALLGQAVAFQAADAGIGFAVQRIGGRQAGQKEKHQPRGAHQSSSSRSIQRSLRAPMGASSSRRKWWRRAVLLCR